MNKNVYALVGLFLRILATIALVASVAPTATYAAPAQNSMGTLAAANRISLDFETLTDMANVAGHYVGLGITFSGATILSQGGSLNYLGFPPRSGRNVIYDISGGTGVITITFDNEITGKISKVGGYITGNRPITMAAYDANGNLLGSQSTGEANYAPVGIPNMLLEITSATSIARVELFDSGNTFTVDDFFFENEQQCHISNVPLYKQGSGAVWANDGYGGTTASPWVFDDDGDGLYNEDPKNGINDDKDRDKNGNEKIDEDTVETIAKWGCAISSAAMIVSYYGSQQTGRTTNPRDLNNWLKANQGYSGGSIKWDKVAEFARDGVGTSIMKGQGIAPNFYSYNSSKEEWARDDGVVNTYLCNKAPVILETKSGGYSGGHYVVATGQVGENTWSVNDPGGFNLPQLTSPMYQSLRKYSNSPRDLASLTLQVHSPVEVLIIDPAGRKTGFDPSTGQFYYEIVDASYGVEFMGAQDGSGTSVETKVVQLGSPISGRYQVFVNGVGTGRYEIEITAYDMAGNSSSDAIRGVVDSASSFVLELDYSSSVGSKIDVPAAPGNIYLPSIRR